MTGFVCGRLWGGLRVFESEEKVRKLISRTATKFDLAGRQALDAGFGGGRGGVYLDLSAEQYRKLRG